MDGNVQLEKNKRIGRIKFFHPKGNSLPSNILQKLVQALENAEKDPDIRVIILESKGLPNHLPKPYPKTAPKTENKVVQSTTIEK